MPLVVHGLTELRAELRATHAEVDEELTRKLTEGATKLAVRARSLAPEKSGHLAASGSAFVEAGGRAGVRFTDPGANVQEFATDYLRQRPGNGGTAARATKRAVKRGYTSAAGAGLVAVHMVNVAAKGPSGGRFAYKARDELEDELVGETWEGIVEILRTHGWFAG